MRSGQLAPLVLLYASLLPGRPGTQISPLLAAYIREHVIVRYDPRDITGIRVFHKNQLICGAVDPDHEIFTLTFKDMQAACSALGRNCE